MWYCSTRTFGSHVSPSVPPAEMFLSLEEEDSITNSIRWKRTAYSFSWNAPVRIRESVTQAASLAFCNQTDAAVYLALTFS